MSRFNHERVQIRSTDHNPARPLDQHLELLAPSGRGKNRKDHGTKQLVKCVKRSGTKRSEAAAKADRMHATNVHRIDRAGLQRANRLQARAEKRARKMQQG